MSVLASQVTSDYNFKVFQRYPGSGAFSCTCPLKADMFDIDPSLLANYCPVAILKACDLEEVFEICNLWQTDSLVHVYYRMHSLSVGDIVQCLVTNKMFLCEGAGWGNLSHSVSQKLIDQIGSTS